MITLCINSTYSEEFNCPFRLLFLITLNPHNSQHILEMQREDNLIPTMLICKLRHLAIKLLIFDYPVVCIFMVSKCQDKM